MLTSKQKELLLFIHEKLQASGVPPSFDEMKEALELKSKSGIHRLITALEERGFIRRLAHRARALEVIRLPEGMHDPRLPSRPANYVPAVYETTGVNTAGVRQIPSAVGTPAARAAVTIPVVGRIAAGVPIAAIQNHEYDLDVPADLVTGGEHFALEVKGDSMVNAGILDADVVILRRTHDAANGDSVCAVIDREEATLKTLRRRGGSIALEAANPAYETRIFGPDRVDIQGRLVGLIRRY